MVVDGFAPLLSSYTNLFYDYYYFFTIVLFVCACAIFFYYYEYVVFLLSFTIQLSM